MGDLTARLDMVQFWSDTWGIGPALEMRLLHSGFAAGAVGLWVPNDLTAVVSTVVLGRDASDGVEGAYVGGTLAAGLRVSFGGRGVASFSPSTSLYVGATHRLDGSDTQILAGLQMGLGLLSATLAAVVRSAF